jgi:hypothetical protein
MNKLAIIFLCITVGLAAFGIGRLSVSTPKPTELQQAIAGLQEGDSIEYVLEQGEVSDYSFSDHTITAKDEAWPTRVLSWFGLSAGETVAKRQGIQIGSDVIGQSKGYGVLEQLWTRVKSIFWFGTFGLLLLVVLAFVPATSGVARSILRFFAGLIPAVGSLVERAIGKRQTEAAEGTLTNVVNSVQSARDELKKTAPDIAPLVDAVLDAEQDKQTKQAVKAIKNA